MACSMCRVPLRFPKNTSHVRCGWALLCVARCGLLPLSACSLDSSAKEIQIQITDKEALDAILAASTRPDGVQLTCEVVGFLGQFLTHFTDGFLVDIPAVEIMKKTLDPSTGTITVSVKRTLPLSSSHGGQPLRLAFHIVPRIVVVTEPFVVLAKQGKTGSVKKILKSRPQPPLSTERLVARAELSAAMPALLPAPVWPRQPGGGRGNGMNGFVASKVESKAPATPTITMELRPTRPPSYAKTLTGPSHKRQRDPDSSYASDASPTDSRIPLPPPPVGLESMVSFGSLPSPSLLGTAFSPFLPAPGGQMTHLDSLQYEMTPTLALLVQAAVANADSEHMGGSGDLVQE
jgi:LSD1 subclass zinc finger protein